MSCSDHNYRHRPAKSADQTTIRTVAALEAHSFISPAQKPLLEEVARQFSVAITPDMAELVTGAPQDDPVAAQFVPTQNELEWQDHELTDPIGDEKHSPVDGIVHRYPDRVLLKPVHTCPVYCRFCFRREHVGTGGQMLTSAQTDTAIAYIANHPEIFEVIITGGDPFILSPRRIAELTARLSAIEHVGVIRFHTRVPVVAPGLITPELVKALSSPKAVFVALHSNHAKELTPKARNACARLIGAGIPMVSQTVLLKGVNDTPEDLTSLFRALLSMRIKPYYLHHGDLARGTSHFRTTIAQGQQLARTLRATLSGLAQPVYVLDIPGGHGKVPIGPSYIENGSESPTVLDPNGNRHPYID